MFRVIVVIVCQVLLVVETKICSSMDIRNSISELNKLRDCHEIAGHLKIVLIERVESESEFDEYLFPELTHISGYLLFYQVYNLSSVGKLFPNLRVIRGTELMLDYSLVIYNMPDLREVGTKNLMFIARGYVKVDKSPHMCYVDTIDWKKLGAGGLHFSNMNPDRCEPCPMECREHCWNSMTCQETDVEECHEECLGCTKPNSPRHCFACKNFDDNGVCVAECPPSEKYVQRDFAKCVTEEMCRNNLNGTVQGTWFPFQSECVKDCPISYRKVGEGNNTKCEYCGGNCTKYCKVTKDVESMDSLQQLRGCTHIFGSLTLRLAKIDPAEIIGDLEEYLGLVKYISDGLMIARSEAITNLMFLQNLTEIEGTNLRSKHAIFVYENPNLQSLWNFSDDNFKLRIKNGSIAFHNNPLLCISEIEKLSNHTNIVYNDIDVSSYSNGDKAACNRTDFFTILLDTSSNSTNISWKAQSCHGECIGYAIFYRPVRPDEVVTTIDSEGECIGTYWTSLFTSNTSTVLKDLRPFTRYAYYIKIYHQNSTQGSQSDVKYFETLPDDPDNPRDVVAHALDSETVTLEWMRPKRPNGGLKNYFANYNVEPDDLNLIDLRNYCEFPKTREGETIDNTSKLFKFHDYFPFLENVSDPIRDGVCICPSNNKNKPPKVYFDDISLYTMDHHYSLCDVHSQSKFAFDQCKDLLYITIKKGAEKFMVTKRSETKSSKSEDRFNGSVIIHPDATSYNFTGLKHFTVYVFYFMACNEIDGKYRCSGVEQTFTRTLPRKDADDITEIIVTIQPGSLSNVVKVQWNEPIDPNGMILSYKVTYTKENNEFSKPITECLPRNSSFNSNQWVLTNLAPGKYSVKVQAESLAGLGRHSRQVPFEFYPESRREITKILYGLLTCAVILSAGAFTFCWWYRKKHIFDDIHLIATINPEYEGFTYEPDEWEIERSDIELLADLGHGSFGTVYQGVIKSKNFPCAIKTANKEHISFDDRMEFLNEASVMKSFSNCHHVVRLMGVVSRGEPALVVMELMERGDLKKFLYSTRDSSHSLTSNEIYRMAVEIADGMTYLSAKKFVHRDLAARNCMVASDRTVKIGDFGMARDIYETDYYKKETKGLLPVRWMAPESLADGVFTADSDVWSYGVVLWEIATLAEQPYQGLSNEQVLQFVTSKGRLERPSECSDLFYEVMKQCWSWRPIDRPTFWDIVEKLEDHVGEDFKAVSFIHSREGLAYRTIHGRARINNPPAMGVEPEEDLLGHYNVSDDEVSLHVGTAPRRPSYLQSTLSQSRDSRSLNSEPY